MLNSQKKSFGILFICVATELIGFGLIIPILPQLSLTLKTSPLQLGLLMAAYSAAQFISAPILGHLSDIYGRKPLLVLSKIGSLIGYLVLAVSHTYPLFLLSRLIDGFTGGNISIARAYVADITSPEDRPKGMAIIGIAFGVGFIIGPAIGGLLYGMHQRYLIPALVAALCSAIATLVTFFWLPEPPVRRHCESGIGQILHGFSILKFPIIASICMFQLIYMMLFSGFETTLSVFTHIIFAFTERTNSWLFVYAGLMTLLVQGTIARKKNLPLIPSLLVGTGCMTLGFGLLSLSSSLLILGISLAFLSIGIGIIGAFLPSLFSLYVSPNHQGKAMGIFEGLGSLSRVLGPIIGFCLFSLSPRIGYVLFSSILLLSGLVFFSLLNYLTKKPT